MRFRLRQMEAFRAVMLTGSMNGAARLLYISQPAVSRLIAHTEQTLGLRLFDRDRGKLTPTAEAQLLFKEVETMFEEAVRIDDFARDLSSNPAGALRFCCSPSLALNFLPPVIASYMKAFPQVRLKFHTTLLSNIADELLARKVEMAVSVLPLDHPNLIVEPFAAGRMVCILPVGHPLESQEEVELHQIPDYPLIGYARNIPFGRIMSGAFERAGIPWRVAVEIVRAESACAFVREGIGIAIVDEFSVAGHGWAGVVVKPLREEIPLTLSLLRSRFDRPSSHAQSLARMIREHAKRTGRGIGGHAAER
ncbi:LysR family transcriptional regulator [Caballeronia hypogeia]|uniref:LysR family transcriptional regulator n=1 Tax=Caballeronia hypogeia TaxID=1777140 RepID=A0A158DQ30_9BURK|nr:LysR substrate-binding domain-containing protein [Caballeronia hypogeia]SAK95857.1 LysR family transcriptional regulator [Caballeronia hypogeia]